MAVDASSADLAGVAPATHAPWTRYLAWQRWGMLAVLLMVIVFNYIDTFVISVLIEPIKAQFHVSDTLLGLLSGLCFSLLYALCAVPFARWADYGNRRTVIVAALAGWSGMTALCGMAQSFWQLAVARFGVGAAAAGGLPPVQSLVADYFAPEHRGAALGLVNAAMNVGIFVGIALGGLIAAAASWRAALLWLGLPGLALALIARLVLSEPRASGPVLRSAVYHEAFKLSLERLYRKRSFVFSLVAVSVYCIFAYGSSTFMPSFMMRTLHASLQQASAVWGVVILAANVLGSVAGGWIGDRLSRRDIRWYGWLPAITCATGAALYFAAFLAPNFWSFISIEFCAESALGIGFPAMYAGLHVVCGSRRRALAVGFFFLSMVLCGNSVGPAMVGIISDALAATQGGASLRYALIASVFVVVPASFLFWAGGQAIPNDLED